MLLSKQRQTLYNAPQPGPSTFIVQCLYVVPLLGPAYAEGFCHLLLSAHRHFRKREPILVDFPEAKLPATQLVVDILSSAVSHEERILPKILADFNIELKDIGYVISGSKMNHRHLEKAKEYVEHYVSGFIESKSYMTAVTLLEWFSICSYGEPLLVKIMEDNQFKAAEKWASFMGKPILSSLVQKYLDMKMLKDAYKMVKKHDLRQEFPDVYHLYKESSLKKLAEKGCWDVAEFKTNKDRQLLAYLVYLAMEAGYTEKVDELCERYSLEGFVNVSGFI